LSTAGDLQDEAGGAGAQPCLRQRVDRHRAQRRPRDVAQEAEDAVEVDGVRDDQAVGDQVEPQVDVRGVGGRRVQLDLAGDRPRSATPRTASTVPSPGSDDGPSCPSGPRAGAG